MSPVERCDVVIVGGGIAGCSAAWFAARAGRQVVLVDAGRHRASDLPLALINPLRGRTGRLVADGVDGMRATFDLIDTLRTRGFRIDAGRGLFRPLVGVVGEALSKAYWTERIGDRLAFDWHAVAPDSLGLVAPVAALFLPDAGWLSPHGLLAALASDSRAECIGDRVSSIEADGRGGGRVALAGGRRLEARSLLWCGGAWGAALVAPGAIAADDRADDRLDDDADSAVYKPGSLIAIAGLATSRPLSFGLYAVPLEGTPPRTLIGPTRESASVHWPEGAAPPEVIRHLEDRIARLFGATIDASKPGSAPPGTSASEIWRGVRLTRLARAAERALHDVPTLTALGSRGFLLGPLLAERWADSLSPDTHRDTMMASPGVHPLPREKT